VFSLKNEIVTKLSLLPPVHEAVNAAANDSRISQVYNINEITWAVRNALARARQIIMDGEDCEDWKSRSGLTAWVLEEALTELKELGSTLKKVVNATGVILHTNCGRAVLASQVADYVSRLASNYNNLELDVRTGKRGSRYNHVEELLKELTGAESSLVVNNNAAAVLLVMNTFARQKEVIVSRGELVEIGGSFRIPEVLKAGGAILTEVGTTNRTWLKDYKEAINSETALLLKVHTSNYRIQGFTHSVPLQELVELGKETGIPVVKDLGSGSLIDGSEYGLPEEPTVQEAVKAGASLVTFSGDKLLGGPQVGIIVGKAQLIEQLKANQLTRALRVDKLTLAALVATLQLYRQKDITKIPIWRMIAKKQEELFVEARKIKDRIDDIINLEAEVMPAFSCVGGGAFPMAELPTAVCAVKPKERSCRDLENFLRQGRIPILTRLYKEKVVIDPRTLLPGDEDIIVSRLKQWPEAHNNSQDNYRY